jgi:hypothetical protein
MAGTPGVAFSQSMNSRMAGTLGVAFSRSMNSTQLHCPAHAHGDGQAEPVV